MGAHWIHSWKKAYNSLIAGFISKKKKKSQELCQFVIFISECKALVYMRGKNYIIIKLQ